MTDVFGSTYASTYDLLYRDKDYAAECSLIDNLFRRYTGKAVSSVLDLGSGTGSHAFPLTRLGYEVVGVERSTEMLAQSNAKRSKETSDRTPTFHQGDIRDFDLGRSFDAAIMMFAVLGYQLENTDVLSALRAARRHLAPGGLLAFDVWYGPAVLYQRPSDRVKVIANESGKVIRLASGTLDLNRQLCAVHFRMWRLSGNVPLTELEETHLMRFFFPLELKLFLEAAGFDLIRLGAFPEWEAEPSAESWNVLAVARAT